MELVSDKWALVATIMEHARRLLLQGPTGTGKPKFVPLPVSLSEPCPAAPVWRTSRRMPSAFPAELAYRKRRFFVFFQHGLVPQVPAGSIVAPKTALGTSLDES